MTAHWFKPGLIGASLLLMVAGQALAQEETSYLRLAELVIGNDKPQPRESAARNQRERAGALQREEKGGIPVDEDGGLFAPRGLPPADERNYDSNRSRAKAYQQGAGGETIYIMPQGGVPPAEGSAARATDQRQRARMNVNTGSGQNIDLSNVGRDGIPLVPCHDVDNVSGRIGDDSLSGSIVNLIRNGQQIKVRCR